MDRDLSSYHKEDQDHVSQALALAESQEHCFRGWPSEEHNKDGCCCCNCVHQKPINAHPWNRANLVRGSVTQIVGWGCNPPDLAPFITFFENPHGMCEMYSRKKHGQN